MSEKNKTVVGMDSMRISTESMQMSGDNQKSGKPNTTNPTQVKPDFTPPPQKKVEK